MKQEFVIRYKVDLFFSGALAVSAAGRALDFLIFPEPPTEYVRRLGSTQLWGAMFATAAVLIVAGVLRELWLLRIGPPPSFRCAARARSSSPATARCPWARPLCSPMPARSAACMTAA